MRTVAFYSYKGGMGKSLAASNFAVCLSRLGKNCALLDLDFAGPSVHTKIPGAIHAPGPGGGFLKYFLSHVDAELWPMENPTHYTFKPPEDLRYYTQLMTGETNEDLKGAIHLIPAGNVYQPDYWDAALSPLSRRIFGCQLEKAKGSMTDADFQSCNDYLQEVKTQIALLKPEPEYLIVDLRSGAHELAQTVIAAWVDLLVCMFAFNEDNIAYMSGILKRMHSDKIIPVLSRVPTGIEFRGDRHLRSMLEILGLEIEDLCVLHSDRDLEMLETLRLGFDRPPQNSKLSHDYVELFERLLMDGDRPPDGLLARIGLPPDLHEQDRVFRLETDTGALINPNDNSRNVSFRVQTFQFLLAGLRDGLAGTTDTPADQMHNRKRFRNGLFSAGKMCGHKFGKALSEDWNAETETKSKYLTEDFKVSKWCDFDSDVGFGRFELDRKTVIIMGGNLTKGDVVLRESFLTPANDTGFQAPDDDDPHPYCAFMHGYVVGVLQEILDGSVEVEHRALTHDECEERFGLIDPRSESCVFHIERPPFDPDRIVGDDNDPIHR